MQRKLFSILASIGLVLGMVSIAVPASASHATVDSSANLMPNDNFSDKDQLSDGFDGVDGAAHLTTITDPDASQVTWYACPNGVTPQTPNSGCITIGTDSTGVQPDPSTTDPGGHSVSGSYEAYDVTWNIPASFDNASVDIVTNACTGTPSTTTGGNPESQAGVANNCLQRVESNIFLDDSSSDAWGSTGFAVQDFPTGEIVGVCYSNCGATNAVFEPLPHGSVVPSDGFVLRFRTSPDVTDANACLDTNLGADPSPEPTGCDDGPWNGTSETTPSGVTTYKQWDADFTTPFTYGADGTDADLAIFGNGNDNAFQCTGDFASGYTGTDTGLCVFDEHYVVLEDPKPTTAALTFNYTNTTPLPQNDGNCKNPDTTETNRQDGDWETVTGCLYDQWERPIYEDNVTFQSSGVGRIEECNSDWGGDFDTGHRHPANATTGDWYCHTENEPDGSDAGAHAELSNDFGSTQNPGALGDQVVTYCWDEESGQGDPLPAQTPTATHGCADETVKASVTKTWVADVDHVHLVFSGTGTASDPCHTGDVFKTNKVGDQDTLLACAFDAANRPATTQMQERGEGETKYELDWFNSNPQAVAFTSNPPKETGPDGRATQQIQAVGIGSSTIEVCENWSGSCAQVTKSVTEGQQNTPECNDGVDNDGDGRIDYPNDLGCADVNDDTEDSEGTSGPPVTSGNCSGRNEGERSNNPGGGQTIVGTQGDDILTGTSGDDLICGLGGNDIIDAGDGGDVVSGDAGDDQIDGGGGKDKLSGNAGNDSIDGRSKNDVVKGGGGDDTLRGNGGFDTIRGGGGKDTLQGGKGDDVLRGGKGNDTLKGHNGDDILNGGADTDTCKPGKGNDKVSNCER